VFVTGGTSHGVEGVVAQEAHRRGIPLLAVLVRDSPPGAIAPTITHAHVVGDTLWDKGAALYRLVKRHDGLAIFIGGGTIVSDEIQTASNLRVPLLLMDGPEGASTLHAREQPALAFRTADEVVATLADRATWRAPRDPFWHPGPNPCADVVLLRRAGPAGPLEVLLVRRHDDAPASGGQWALPGGFVRSAAPRGAAWAPGAETAIDACVRECREETGLDVARLAPSLREVGVYEGDGRDPRDDARSWARSTAFTALLPPDLARAPMGGADDACEARWFAVDRCPELAFDHARILADALVSSS
jgi:ADP-ribose pyrophosphatase YjhB (NUDIX family)